MQISVINYHLKGQIGKYVYFSEKMAAVILEYLNSYETELLKLTFLEAMILWGTCCEHWTRSVGMLFAVQKGKYKACLHCD